MGFGIASIVGVFLEGFTAFLVTRLVAGGGAAFIWTAMLVPVPE